ncbi:hypothetical protein NMY22_g8939 [Coprinellus aureogranulatus]|nr:hypothetical protein NMY22_g8939 [Coprinellus aureogranulatus]
MGLHHLQVMVLATHGLLKMDGNTPHALATSSGIHEERYSAVALLPNFRVLFPVRRCFSCCRPAGTSTVSGLLIVEYARHTQLWNTPVPFRSRYTPVLERITYRRATLEFPCHEMRFDLASARAYRSTGRPVVSPPRADANVWDTVPQSLERLTTARVAPFAESGVLSSLMFFRGAGGRPSAFALSYRAPA